MKTIFRPIVWGAMGAAGLLAASVNLCAQDRSSQESSDSEQTRQRLIERRRAELEDRQMPREGMGAGRAERERPAAENFEPERTRQRMMERRRESLGDEFAGPLPPRRGYGAPGAREALPPLRGSRGPKDGPPPWLDGGRRGFGGYGSRNWALGNYPDDSRGPWALRGAPGLDGPRPLRDGRGWQGRLGPQHNFPPGPGFDGGRGFRGGRGGLDGLPPRMGDGGRGFGGYGPQHWGLRNNYGDRPGRWAFRGGSGRQDDLPPMGDGRGRADRFGPQDNFRPGPGSDDGQGFHGGGRGQDGPPPMMREGGRRFGSSGPEDSGFRDAPEERGESGALPEAPRARETRLPMGGEFGPGDNL